MPVTPAMLLPAVFHAYIFVSTRNAQVARGSFQYFRHWPGTQVPAPGGVSKHYNFSGLKAQRPKPSRVHKTADIYQAPTAMQRQQAQVGVCGACLLTECRHVPPMCISLSSLHHLLAGESGLHQSLARPDPVKIRVAYRLPCTGAYVLRASWWRCCRHSRLKGSWWARARQTRPSCCHGALFRAVRLWILAFCR